MCPDGTGIPMSNVLCITCKPGHILIYMIENNEVFCGVCNFDVPSVFVSELNRLQTSFTEYLNRKGIPEE